MDTNQADVIVDWTPPHKLVIPLIQHQGKAAKVVVSEGEPVHNGQPLTHSDNLFEVPVHASVTGIVESISKQQITLRKTPAKDGGSHPELSPADNSQTQHPVTASLFDSWTVDHYIRQIHNAGLVGMGGSCYPVAAKISKLNGKPADTLLINAAECDPSISCDEALLDQSIDEIATGICLAQRATNPAKTIIGVEADKSRYGHRLLRKVCEHHLQRHPYSEEHHPEKMPHTELRIVPARYPSGAESLLMSKCLGHTITAEDIHNSNLISFNIGTCYAIAQALVEHNPCTHRIVTVIDSKRNQHNFRLPLGTPVSDLAAHFNESSQCSIVIGGEMMGRPVGTNAVVTKASNCIQFKPLQHKTTASPCVRCSLCVDACPVNLMPQFLLVEAAATNYGNLQKLNLKSCIECTCCDRVCPSHIPLASIFAASKKAMTKDIESRHQAELAKARFEKRQARLESNIQREFRKLDKKQSTLNPSDKTGQEAKRKLVEEALQRAKNKKHGQLNARSATNRDKQP